ncbi:MAG: nicotinate phosphoribosyltransferase [Solidesulfovibrio sp. DCME]|uniref:nicotinate phosphoribosyltransferase n=1 Tax=Solidesulfovibrio sp. DCME TaxID=3447380 RepID=UPI003D0A82F8
MSLIPLSAAPAGATNGPMPKLPDTLRGYVDKYFLRSRHILAAEGLDPVVTMQVFFRDGPGVLAGVDEAVALLREASDLAAHGGSLYALPEGAAYTPLEPVMHITGRLQDFIELETLYLGIISAATSLAAGLPEPRPEDVEQKAAAVRALLPEKNLMYFGARHWHPRCEEAFCRAAVAGGFDACATDAGARAAGLPAGVGTIPHALVLAFAGQVGRERATCAAAAAFDRHIEASCPRVALVDTFNHEVDDALATAKALGQKLAAVRLDTAGELIGQGGEPFDGRPYWTGTGVTVAGTLAVRRALDAAGFAHVGIVLSSGFGNLEKIKAFVQAENEYGRLFESLGIGGLFRSYAATADIVRLGGADLAKTGRAYRENPRLVRFI